MTIPTMPNPTSPTASSESSPALKTRIHSPLNAESSFLNPPSLLTSAGHFFIRDHFPVPTLDPATYRLQIAGELNHPLSLSLADLKFLPPATHTCVLECAGNGRLFLPNTPEGVQWRLGAAGCAAWTGVRLRDILALAGLQPNAVELVFEGADHGRPEKQLKPKDEIAFARSLPLAAANQPEVLLAWQMNGEDLPPAHGAPLRLIVPGWYSVASVKWLHRITAVARPFLGYFQTVEYAIWTHSGALPPERTPITELLLKSQIAHPVSHQQLPAGQPCRVYGAAWSSGSPIDAVEVSTDNGRTWRPAQLDTPATDHAWQLWHFEWTPPTPGSYTLRSRAFDHAGNTQPAQHNDDHESYLIHHTLPVPVEVL